MATVDGNALITLLDAKSATGDLAFWAGGDGTLFLSGTPGGATASLEWASGPSASPRQLDQSVALTAVGAVNFTLPPGWLRVAITGGAGVSLTAEVKRIPR